MVDLLPYIRSFILADTALTANLSSFDGSKAVFTRRPVPEDADYPFILINPQITQTQSDYVNLIKRDVIYDIIVYGQNDTAANYRKVEETAFLLARKFARLRGTDMEMPTGFYLVQAVGIGSFPAPTDDQTKAARAVSVTFTIAMEQ